MSKSSNSAGKGDSPRNVGPRFKRNYDNIDWRYTYCFARDEEHVYIIRADEQSVFEHWCAARRGQRHFPQNFNPFRLDNPEKLRFKEWRIEES